MLSVWSYRSWSFRGIAALGSFHLFDTEKIIHNFFSMSRAKSWRKSVISLAFGPLALALTSHGCTSLYNVVEQKNAWCACFLVGTLVTVEAK